MTPKTEEFVPLTVVEAEAEITLEAMAARIQKTRDEHADVLQKYHEIWYNAEHTWVYTHFLGIGLMKCPNDLWIYQALMTNLRPMTVIETGTYSGGSALWFAFLMDMLRIDGGRVFTVDIKDQRKNPLVLHPRITYLAGNSARPELVDAIKHTMPKGPVLVCLDSDHSAEHVHNELELYAPLCKVGDWLVVEDTNIGWSDKVDHVPVAPGGRCSCGADWPDASSKCPKDKGDQGARGGLIQYMDKHSGEWRQDILSERYLLTMHPGGWMQRIAECSHV